MRTTVDWLLLKNWLNLCMLVILNAVLAVAFFSKFSFLFFGLIWVQTVCKGYHQMTLADEELTKSQVIIFIKLSLDMLFTTLWHFEKLRLRRACAASF